MISYIAEYAESLGNGRGIMRCDIVIEGQLMMTYEVGSPAPLATVKRYERKLILKNDDA